MKKKFQKYANIGLAATLLLTAMPLQMVSGADNVSEKYLVGEPEIVNSEENYDSIAEESLKLGTVDEAVEETQNVALSEETEDVTASFTDENFRSAVRSTLRLGENEPITRGACEIVEELNINNKDIGSLEGIEYFTGLTYLDCDDNCLTSLDVTKCTKLAFLYCSRNQLEELNVRGCTSLVRLFCEGNYLTTLDVGQSSRLDTLNCSQNQIKTLDVSNCTDLTYLNCAWNPLESLECCHNMLMTLYLYGCEDLMKLDCSGNRLSDLELSGCSSLAELNCSNNYLKGLSLSGCENLVKLDCSYNYMESLDAVTGKNDSLTEENFIFEPQNTDADVTESFMDPNFQAKIRWYLGIGEDEPILKSACGAISKVELWEGDIKSLEGIKNLTGLKDLSCRLGQLESLDVSGLTNLKELNCHGGQLVEINAGGCTNLERISCGSNQLSKINVDGCSRLLSLGCSDNQLESLDVSSCNALIDLECINNQLQSLDISACSNLFYFWCDGNQLKNLDVSGCSKLINFGCSNNQLKDLDISKCPNLRMLHCNNNNMKDISDITGDTSNIMDFRFDPQNTSPSESPMPEPTQTLIPEPTTSTTPEPTQTAVPEPTTSVTPAPTDTPTQTPTPELTQTPTPEPTNTPTQAPKKLQKLTVTPGSLELYVGGTAKNLKVSNAKGVVTYKSSAPKIVKVNSKGKVTPVSEGKASITVRAAGDSAYEAASKKINVTVYGKPAKVKGVKAAPAKTKRTLKVSWKKVPSVSGYIIKYSYNKNMKNSETIRVNKGNTTSKTLKKLTSKKYVYIQVQAFKQDGSALVKGAWSAKTRSGGKIK